MNKRPTIVLVIVALALWAWVATQNNETTITPGSEVPTQEIVPTLEYLFPANKGIITSILVESRDGKSVAMERVGAGWKLTLPVIGNADSGAVEAAATQLTALLVQTRLSNLDPAEAGLTSPSFTLTVGFSDGSFEIAFVGDKTTTDSGYYVRKNDGAIVVISASGIDALTAMLDNLPLPPTETPAASPTPTPESATATKSP